MYKLKQDTSCLAPSLVWSRLYKAPFSAENIARYKTWGHQIINNWAELTTICCHNEFSNSLPTRTPTVGARTITFAQKCANAMHYTAKCPRGTALHLSAITKLLQFSYFCSINEHTPFLHKHSIMTRHLLVTPPSRTIWSESVAGTNWTAFESDIHPRSSLPCRKITLHCLVSVQMSPFQQWAANASEGRGGGEDLIAIPVCNNSGKLGRSRWFIYQKNPKASTRGAIFSSAMNKWWKMRQTVQLLAFLNIVYTPNGVYIMHGAVFNGADQRESNPQWGWR